MSVRSIAVAVSILVNALLGGAPTETLSYRAARARDDRKRWGCVLCQILDTVDLNHCDKTLKWWREVNGRK